MNLNNLVFFDREGQSYNFSQDQSGTWIGADYFQPVSTALYDVSNIFILEKTEAGYRFPTLEPGSSLNITWQTAQSKDQLFLFTVSLEDPADETTNYLARQNSIAINYSDFGVSGQSNLDITYPLQLNVGFAPTEEVAYTRNLLIYYTTQTGTTLIANISFYGEGEDEDERFRIWLTNFGIKFNREDALLLKEYDIKESLPDWSQINQARKQILVNRDQIYPYVGTYKGLINLIDILGYRDVLRVKEYWKDSDTKSAYYNKFAMVDVTDLMTSDSIDQLNLIDLNGQIKKGGKFVKTSFIALAYEFSVATDTYDEYGLPNVELTTQFEPDEVFYKLNQLAKKLKTEILPVNVIIKDIIGEFIYFQRLSLRDWTDPMIIDALDLNERYEIQVNSPNLTAQQLLIRDIKTLYPATNGSLFPFITYNTSKVEPYSVEQIYPVSSILNLISAITNYYQNIKTYEFNYHGESNPMWVGDEASDRIGCPIVLEAYISDFTISELTGSKFGDFNNSHYTIRNIRYRSGYEIEWTITGSAGYKFTRRGLLSDLVELPIILPHAGNYIVQAKIYDLNGASSISYRTVTVENDIPSLEAFTRLQDKNSYRIKDLANVTLGDIASSPLYLPFANILQNGGNSVISNHYFDYFTYMNNFGIGGQQNQVKIYTDPIGFEPISESLNECKRQWGTGTGYKGQTTLGDIRDAQIGDLVMNRLSEFTYMPSVNNGFYIDLDSLAGSLEYINFSPYYGAAYQVPSYSDINDLVNQLNLENNSQVAAYRYSVVSGKIHAQAINQDRSLNRIITLTAIDEDTNETQYIVYTFCYPAGAYSHDLVQKLNDQLAQIGYQIDEDLLFLDAPFFDVLSTPGSIAPASDPMYWVNRGFISFSSEDSQDFEVTGFLPSNYDQNAFTLNNTKIGLDGLVVPLFHPVIVAISNVYSKSQCDWTLYAYDQEIVKIRSNSYFIWRFEDVADYRLTVEVTDFNGNKFTLSTSVNIADTKTAQDYQKYVKMNLDTRKSKLQSKL